MFIWWNGRVEKECIFTRLDKILVNQEFIDLYLSNEVHHLVRQGGTRHQTFLIPKFWTKHKGFDEVVKQHWRMNIQGSPFIFFHGKLKNIKKAFEARNPTNPTNKCELSKAEAKLRKYPEYWRQKTGMKRFKEEDSNTKFFHSYIRGRRKKLHLSRIKNIRRNEVITNEQMRETTI
ncbi:hypothetical protein H5410_031505 [Solanum commersonii]|uniref:Uncharacterized protein n=1 Tax=Solanum commersonii TaxID=4109 RepID=A0A9J5YK49_SOLCO|nr:hypothetical protein H5410_031505 [Solanum commersonii]